MHYTSTVPVQDRKPEKAWPSSLLIGTLVSRRQKHTPQTLTINYLYFGLSETKAVSLLLSHTSMMTDLESLTKHDLIAEEPPRNISRRSFPAMQKHLFR